MGDSNTPPNLPPPLPPQKGSPMPPLPSSGATGSSAPARQLPPIRRPGSPGKVVVMLSSVAKAPPVAPAPGEKSDVVVPHPLTSQAMLRPPPLPVNRADSVKKPGTIPPIKLNEPALSGDDSPGESIFPDANAAPGAPTVVPPLNAHSSSSTATGPLAPPRIIPAAAPPPLHVAPPMVEQGAEEHAEKLRPPHLPSDAPDEGGKVPPLVTPELPFTDKPLSALPGKLSSPVSGKETSTASLKKSTPIIVSSTAAPLPPPLLTDTKSTLKPPVMSKRAQAHASGESKVEDPPVTPGESTELPLVPPAALLLPVTDTKNLPSPAAITPPAKDAATPSKAATPAPAGGTSFKPPAVSKPPLPPTRVARAKKRRMTGTVAFYAVFIVTLFFLYRGVLFFGRDTRVEGQVIPPDGMTLNNEVWLVTDFREFASGIAEDLAAERTPLSQEIQERQQHVQRAQADVAAREERIRLIQQDIQSAKDEMANVGKQARDAMQKLWAGEGAEIDAEYADHTSQLQKAIADRAKSLNLKYNPDPTYNSPEVWANAYRLGLYDVPATVDQAKEHQWLSDQMTQWRNFVKSLDDRRAKLVQEATDIKTANGPKLADLQAKIDQANQRVDATQAEEVPLKAELQQAQADLIEAQAADAGLDDKYYKQLYALPREAVPDNKHIAIFPNGRFSWVDDDIFPEGVNRRDYWIFACATRADGRQYWALGRFTLERNHKACIIINPDSFVSTKAILRPNLSPEELEQ